MNVGTKSVLFGIHAFWLHPWFVAAAWWKLYGFPWDPRLWVAFFVHDIGYWGSPNMDGPEGERHPEIAARWMRKWFDTPWWVERIEWTKRGRFIFPRWHWRLYGFRGAGVPGRWESEVLYHSRFYARRDGRSFSRLCVADKLSFCLTPRWLYFLLGDLSGEIDEYIARAKEGGKYEHMNYGAFLDKRHAWHAYLAEYLREWVGEHKDLRTDSWTRV
jgi:hypothetical protein